MSELLLPPERKLILDKMEVLSEIERLQNGLPHLHGWKWYPWARSFFESRNKMNLLVAANQISKSSTAIRKCIHWATEKELWPKLWAGVPRQIWYLYPSQKVATVEFKTKWIPEQMPRGEFKESAKYGWKANFNSNKTIDSIEWNSGLHMFFRSYEQDVHNLQSGTVAAIFCDEELPVDLFDELAARLSASDGYFHMVFTATRGQEFWKDAMEDVGKPNERFVDAWKKCISMYDCLTYEDGTRSTWTNERIKRRIDQCKNEKEVLKRVMGRFIKDDDLKYSAFDRVKNVKVPTESPPGVAPKDWHMYSGVDLGSGGKSGHPASIVFIAVRPDYKKARVVKVRRFDGIDTTSGDVYGYYLNAKIGFPHIVMQSYDSAARDFFTIADRNGDTFFPAQKGEVGVETLNTLFAYEMLDIDEGIEDGEKLIYELGSVSKTANKRHAKDDAADATRYCAAPIPWDFAGLRPTEKKKADAKPKTELELRREFVTGGDPFKSQNEIDQEIEEWNELAEG